MWGCRAFLLRETQTWPIQDEWFKGLLEGSSGSMGGAKGLFLLADVLPFGFRGPLNLAIISKPVILPSGRNPSITPYQWDLFTPA